MRYPKTPIHIADDGSVLAWIWNGHEYYESTVNGQRIPVYRLGKPKAGQSRNGRLLRIPHRSDFVQRMDRA
jgi:hypothetical protein